MYFGGGTPSLLGAERLRSILQGVREGFALSPGAEITLEANPTQVDRTFFQEAWEAGFNRLCPWACSPQTQRNFACWAGPHSPEQAAKAVADARAAGF